jgi:hypothetical protein
MAPEIEEKLLSMMTSNDPEMCNLGAVVGAGHSTVWEDYANFRTKVIELWSERMIIVPGYVIKALNRMHKHVDQRTIQPYMYFKKKELKRGNTTNQ